MLFYNKFKNCTNDLISTGKMNKKYVDLYKTALDKMFHMVKISIYDMGITGVAEHLYELGIPIRKETVEKIFKNEELTLSERKIFCSAINYMIKFLDASDIYNVYGAYRWTNELGWGDVIIDKFKDN